MAARMAPHRDFDSSLQHLILDSDNLEVFLTGLVALAAESLSRPGMEVSCGIILARPKKPLAMASSAPSARRADNLQTVLEEGPGVSALAGNSTVHASAAQCRLRWPRWEQLTPDTVSGSVVAVAVASDEGSRTVLTVYARGDGVLTAGDVEAAEQFMAQASGPQRLAVRNANVQDANRDLTAALAHRAVIDTALGVVMGQTHCTRETAFGILERASNTRNLKLHRVASAVIASVSAEKRQIPHFDP